eukprot:300210-Ditylum_brightwellii.AAC.1
MDTYQADPISGPLCTIQPDLISNLPSMPNLHALEVFTPAPQVSALPLMPDFYALVAAIPTTTALSCITSQIRTEGGTKHGTRTISNMATYYSSTTTIVHTTTT